MACISLINEFKGKFVVLVKLIAQIFWWLHVFIMTNDFWDMEGIKIKSRGIYKY